jgi:hypothetical protein
MKYAVLIDGGFIRRKLGNQEHPLTFEGVTDFLEELKGHEALSGCALHRIYWYDAPPLDRIAQRPLRGGRVDFGATPLARASRALFRKLSKIPHLSLRRGDLVFRGWRVRRGRLPDNGSAVTLTADDLEPHIQQKGVDMRIGLDIAALAMKGHANVIVLVAGDSDFVPAMKFARREGAQIFLVTLGHVVREEMLEHADLRLELTQSEAATKRERSTVRAA